MKHNFQPDSQRSDTPAEVLERLQRSFNTRGKPGASPETEEQREVISHARPPVAGPGGRRVTSTVAGPGSGKTTMQEHLCVELLKQGHRRILKVFFNTKAADDGRNHHHTTTTTTHSHRVRNHRWPSLDFIAHAPLTYTRAAPLPTHTH